MIRRYYHTVLLCIYIGLTLSAQERLTEYISEGTNKDFYVREYNDQAYLLKVDQNDNLKVFKLLDESTSSLEHVRTLQGLYTIVNDIIFKQNYIIFRSQSEIIEYDFVNDITLKVSSPDGYYLSQIIDNKNTNENRFLVFFKSADGSDTKSMVYETGGILYDLDEHSTFFLFGDDVFEKKSVSYGVYNYYFKNYISGQVDTVAYNMPNSQYPAKIDSSIYYFETDGQVYSFDQITRSSTPLADIRLDQLGYFNSVKVGDERIVLLSELDDITTIKVYDLLSLELMEVFSISLDDSFSFASATICKGVLVSSLRNEIFILDLKTGAYFIRPTYYDRSGFDILEDRYIINPFRTYDQEGVYAKLEVIDLQTLDVHDIECRLNMAKTEFAGFAKFDDQYIASFKYRYRNHHTLIDINLSDNTAFVNEGLDNSTFGLPSKTKLAKLGEEIYVIGPQLLQVDGEAILEITSLEDILTIDNSSVKIQDDQIIFIKEQSKKIYSYDGQLLELEADLMGLDTLIGIQLFNFENIILTDDFVLILDGADRFYRYDKVTKNLVMLEDHVTRFYDVQFVFKNKIYFSNGKNFYTTDGFTPKLILENFRSSIFSLEGGYTFFKDQLLVTTGDGLVRITEDDSVTPIGSGIQPDYGSELIIDQSGNNLLVGNNIHKLHYDGVDFHEFSLEFGEDYSGKGSLDGLFFFRERDDLEIIWTYYNCKNKTYGKLPDELQDVRSIEHLQFNNERFLITDNFINSENRLRVFKTDENFESLELIHEYLNLGYLRTALFSSYEDLGLLHAANHLIFINDQNEFIRLENVDGFDNINSLARDEDVVYFLAKDPRFGRQLFRFKLAHFNNHTSTIDFNKNDLLLFPNPALNYIHFKESSSVDNLISKSYTIYDVTGNMVIKGVTTGLIDITDLVPGSYSIKVEQAERTLTKTFIKQ